MEFPFSLAPLLNCSPSHSALDLHLDGGGGGGEEQQHQHHVLSVWSSDRMDGLSHGGRGGDRSLAEQWSRVVDGMGSASAAAQQLKQVITSSAKFSHSRDRIYMHWTLPSRVNGLLRVGEKKLFIRDEVAAIQEITPLCVLDFFVAESLQRSGIGKTLFDFMLSSERTPPARFGYDRPSPKLLSFLAKHFDLKNFVPQNNNFVVFRKYFSSGKQYNAPAPSQQLQPQQRSQQQQQSRHHSQNSNGNSNLSPTRAVPAGARTSSHSSSAVLTGGGGPRRPGPGPGPGGAEGGDMVPSPRLRGVDSPRDHINQQGGPVSRAHHHQHHHHHSSQHHHSVSAAAAAASAASAAPPSPSQSPSQQMRRVVEYGGYASLQASPPEGQASFGFESGDVGGGRQLRFDQEQDDQYSAQQQQRSSQQQQQQQNQRSFNSTQPLAAAAYPSASPNRSLSRQQQLQQHHHHQQEQQQRSQQQQQQQQPASSPSRGGSSSSSSFHSIFPTQNTHFDDPHHPLSGNGSNYRGGGGGGGNGNGRATPPDTSSSRLSRAGANVLQGHRSNNSSSNFSQTMSFTPLSHQQPQQQSQQRSTQQQQQQQQQQQYPGRRSRPSSGNSNGYGGDEGDRQSRDNPPSLRPSQQHGFSLALPPQSSSAGTAADFLPDGYSAPAAPAAPSHSTELPSERSRPLLRGGVASRPLADPVSTSLLRTSAMDRSIAEREAQIAAKEASLLREMRGPPRFAIPYRQPNERDAAWSKAASHQRVAYGGDDGGGEGERVLASAVGAGGGATSGSAFTGQTEKAAQFSDPNHSHLMGGGHATYAYGPPQPVYTNTRTQAPFAYGRRQ